MDILDVFETHCQQLQKKIADKTLDEINLLIISVLKFYLQFSEFNDIIKKHIFIDLSQKKFLEDLKTDNLEFYRIADKKAFDELDQDDEESYVEYDSMELLLLSGFEYSLHENREEALFYLFDGIINILDFYEQFSDRAEYWNKILAEELANQLQLLDNSEIDLDFYKKKYDKMAFEKI